jgi:GH15 family glucan-1,4-alpha-glucosidase
MMIQALAMSGMTDEARLLLVKNLTKNVNPDGCLVESSRWSGYDYTELDQNGQLVFAVWRYLCWTGDREFVKKFWPVIVRVGDYPLQDVFRNKRTGLLRNKREFWERDDRFGIEDGFELAYQFWMMHGLERGSLVARELGDADTSARWSRAAAELRKAAFEDPLFRFIENDRIIKRRTLDGRWQQYAIPVNRSAMPQGSPTAINEKPELEPDSANLYPIIFGYVDPHGAVARNTLEGMDLLWNQQWSHGGYARYNTTSEPDPPAPWPIASLLVARAAMEMGDDKRAWRAINWVASIHGATSGGWFERYGPSITPPAPPVSVVGWIWAEVVMLIVHHMIGFRPNLDGVLIRPRLIEGLDRLQTTFHVRGSKIGVTVMRSTTPSVTIDGVRHDVQDGGVTVKYPRKGKAMEIVLEVTGR